MHLTKLEEWEFFWFIVRASAVGCAIGGFILWAFIKMLTTLWKDFRGH